MITPRWIQKTVSGTLICFLCGSVVVQVGGSWFCNNLTCEKHTDEPTAQQQGAGGWLIQNLVVGTASHVSGSIVQSKNIDRR